MFEQRKLMFLYVETPLHVGSGRGTGAVDLPIQRERTTNFPMIQASGIKGALREAYRGEKPDTDASVEAIFGKAGSAGENYAGALSPSDAKLLLFPVRSLGGVFAWTTSILALANFKRALELTGEVVPWVLPNQPLNDSGEGGRAVENAWVSSDTVLKAQGDWIVLEDFNLKAKVNSFVDTLATWLGKNAFPQADSYWKNSLKGRLCILQEETFRDFCTYATEVQTHVKLDPDKKTVIKGGLWTTESLPVDTLMYSSLMATKSRSNGSVMEAGDVLNQIAGLKLGYLQIGGNETTGQGWTSVRFFPELADVGSQEVGDE